MMILTNNDKDIECVLLEIEFTNILQSIVEYGHKYALKNFKYHLKMDYEFERGINLDMTFNSNTEELTEEQKRWADPDTQY